jgi:hypothetical protein
LGVNPADVDHVGAVKHCHPDASLPLHDQHRRVGRGDVSRPARVQRRESRHPQRVPREAMKPT